MKKWGILGLVILGGLILGLQYYINKGEKTLPVMQPQPAADQIGVALPPAVTGYIPPEAFYDTAAGSYNSLSVQTSQSSYPGACPGASLAGILAAHGKTWGYFVPKTNVAFEFKDNEPIYKLLAEYSGCLAAAQAEISVCDSLPGELNTDLVKIPLNMSMHFRCREKASPSLFYGYLAGRVKGMDSCSSMVVNLPQQSTGAVINLTTFCEAGAKGMAAGRDYVFKVKPKKKQHDNIVKWLPLSKSDCAGNAECLNRLAIYNAMRGGKVSSCPSGDVYCEAAVAGASPPCEAIVKDLSKTYCATAERVKKRSGGFIGVSKNEMEGQIVMQKAEKASEDLKKKEDEKLLIEINKKAKKILGKE